VITISHDRHFLDRTVKRIFEIENGKLTIYDGNYTDYLRRREIDIAVKREQFENQQKEIARQEEIITRFKQFNREKSIRQAESRQKALDKMELLEKPQGSAAVVELVFHQASPSVKQVLQFDSVTKRYGDKTVIDNFSQLIYRKQKVGIFGANGTGKSTLLKMIAGEEVPDKGQIIAGQNVKTAYYAQQQSFTCETVLEEILYTAEQSLTYTQARNYLASFLFFGEDVQKEIAILSGGEKSRLSLLKTMLAGANLVLLDEPTNHLDIASIEALERAINSYDGTLVMVSHDRQFLNNTCDHLLVFENGVIQPYDGNYAYYLSRIEQQRKEGGQIAEKVKPKREKRDYTLKKMQNKIAVLESEIAALQAQITADEEKMCDEDFYKQADSSDVVLKYQENKALLEEYEEQWLVLSEEYLQNR
jgi:ATP-binding cassette subfamily F protein 3